eukprot:1161505-Pelagomonas_calceolata.AAC.2
MAPPFLFLGTYFCSQASSEDLEQLSRPSSQTNWPKVKPHSRPPQAPKTALNNTNFSNTIVHALAESKVWGCPFRKSHSEQQQPCAHSSFFQLITIKQAASAASSP